MLSLVGVVTAVTSANVGAVVSDLPPNSLACALTWKDCNDFRIISQSLLILIKFVIYKNYE